MNDQANDREGICNDPCIRKPATDQVPIRAGEIDTDYTDLIAPSKRLLKAQIGFAAARH